MRISKLAYLIFLFLFITACVIFFSYPIFAQEKKQVDVPIIINNRHIFNVSAKIGHFTPQQRAQSITNTLTELINSDDVSPGAVTYSIDSQTGVAGFYYGKRLLFLLNENDAAAYGISIDVMASKVIEQIKSLIIDTKLKQMQQRKIYGYKFAIIGFVLMIIIFIIIGVLTRKFYRKIDSIRGTKIKSFKIQEQELISEESIVQSIFSAYKIIRILIIITIFYIYLSGVLSYLPETDPLRKAIFDYPLAYIKSLFDSAIDYTPKLIFIIILLFIFKYIFKLVNAIFDSIKSGAIKIPGFYPDYQIITRKIVKFLIYFGALVLILPNLPGYDSPVFKGLSVIAGIIVSLGSSSFIANVFAGFAIVITRSIKAGDFVKIGDEIGTVTELSLSMVRIRTYENVEVTFPNSIVLQKPVLNYSSPVSEFGGVIVSSTITIGYEVPGEKVEALSLEAASITENVLEKPKPFVLESSLDNSFVTYEIFVYIDKPHIMKNIHSELHSNLRNVFDNAGVEILSPNYSYLRDGNKITIPEKYLDKSYQIPSFRIKNTI